MKLNDLAVACGKKRVSPQTGYVHHCYHALPEEISLTIPLIENVIYALALLQTRTVENVTEARRLLEGLIAFHTQNGQFPLYLHEYPECKDCYQGAHLLVPFYWILKQFHAVLGADLKEKMEKIVQQILTASLESMQTRDVPGSIGIKIAAASIAFGRLNGNAEQENRGKDFIKMYEPLSSMWFDPRCLAEMLTSLQMISPDLSILPGFWTHLCNTWHTPSAAYAGPALRELQFKEEPQVTLYDLFWASFTGIYPERVLRDQPFHLYAALIQPCEAKPIEKNYPFQVQGELNGRTWLLYQNENLAYAFIEQKNVYDPAKDKGFSPLRFVWGSPKRVHTLTCQGGNNKLKNFTQNGSSLQFIADLGDPVPLEDREKSRELAFFFDIPDSVKLTVDTIPVNTFRANDEVVVAADGTRFRLSFEIAEGEGQFMGHFMRGNRLAQLANKGVHRFDAYDWQLFVRTLRRSDHCSLRIQIHLGE